MPSAILNRLNQMLLRHSAELSDAGGGEACVRPACTVVLGGSRRPRASTSCCAWAGTPTRWSGGADGRLRPWGVAGTPLGVTEPVSLTDSVVHLDPARPSCVSPTA